MDHTATVSGFGSILDRIRSDEEAVRVQSAFEIRRLAKTSPENRRLLAGAIEPLVKMLMSENEEANEAAILALLNLAVKDESNKRKIISNGALDPLVCFLESSNANLQEHATATLHTLSASPTLKPTISSFPSAIHLLLQTLLTGNLQARFDAVTTLCNLSTNQDTLTDILSSNPIPPLINHLKTTKKSSKTVEKCVSLLASLIPFNEAQSALVNEPGGVLSVVEAIEEGSARTKEHAVGALLTLCKNDRCKYREVILNEGAIPGLLELTVQGTDKARRMSRELLDLLRGEGKRREELEGGTLEEIVSDIVGRMDGEDRSGKAKLMLAEMVRVSMEESLRHLERRAAAFPCTSNSEVATSK